MPFYERNIVPVVSLDVTGRRRAVRVYDVYGSDISSVVNDPTQVDDAGNTGLQLPAIGTPWTPPGSTGLPQMRLDFYTATQEGNQITLQGHYSTDIDSRNLTLSIQNTVIAIPYAVKVPVGAIVGPARGFAWQHSALNIIVPMTRISVSVRVPIEDVHAVSDLAPAFQGKIYEFAVTTSAAVQLWRFEGSDVSPIGPRGFEARYTFISDPGTRTIAWPTAIGADQLARPEESNGFVRTPFATIVPLPPLTNNQLPNPLQPLPPRFVSIITSEPVSGPPPMYGTPLPIQVD